MKKVLTTIIMLFIILMSANEVYAAITPADLKNEAYAAITPADLKGKESTEENDVSVLFSNSISISSYMDFENTVNTVEQCAVEYYNTTGERLIWTISSVKHKNLDVRIYNNKKSETYQELLNSIDNSYDFVQVGGILDASDLEQTKSDFNEDSIKAFLATVIPIDSSNKEEESYNQINSRNIPVYWNIVETDYDCFALELALGKYTIKQGDTLSDIAKQYKTSIEELLQNNSQIENPNVIYAGDYLVIK